MQLVLQLSGNAGAVRLGEFCDLLDKKWNDLVIMRYFSNLDELQNKLKPGFAHFAVSIDDLLDSEKNMILDDYAILGEKK